MKRRIFLGTGLASSSSFAQQPAPLKKARLVRHGADMFGVRRTRGFSSIAFKVSSADTMGGLFIFEHTNLAKGGPGRHMHTNEDEWFFAMEGEFRVEVGGEELTLSTGDSVLMPRNIPHVWAYAGEMPGKALVAFTPAGNMEEFFRDYGSANAKPIDPATAEKRFGVRIMGPPLDVK